MLVLTRKQGQRIDIGFDSGVSITIVKLDRSHVRIGIEAPRDVVILRGEIERRDARAEAAADEK